MGLKADVYQQNPINYKKDSPGGAKSLPRTVPRVLWDGDAGKPGIGFTIRVARTRGEHGTIPTTITLHDIGTNKTLDGIFLDSRIVLIGVTRETSSIY